MPNSNRSIVGVTRTVSHPIALLLCLFMVSVVSHAEPLGYVARPDRSDLGVVDTLSHTVLGSIPLNAIPYFVEVSPDGQFAYVGLEGDPMVVVNTFDASIAEIDIGKGDSRSIRDVRAVVFDPDEPIAYLANGMGQVVIIDTLNHQVVDILAAFGDFEQLVLSPDRDFLVGRDRGRVIVIDIESGSRAETDEIGAIDLAMLGSNLIGVLTRFEYLELGVIKNTHPQSGSILSIYARLEPTQRISVDNFRGILDADSFLRSNSEYKQIEFGQTPPTVYLGFEQGVIAIFCPENQADCSLGSLGQRQSIYDISEVDLRDLEVSEQRRDFGGMSDLKLTPDQSQVYAVGRRTLAMIDSVDTTLIEAIAVWPGNRGSGALGNISFGVAVEPCTAEASSIAALRQRVSLLDTDDDSLSLLLGKINTAANKLKNGKVIGGRNNFKAFIDAVVWRSNIAPSDTRHVKPGDASGLICDAANLLARLDAR